MYGLFNSFPKDYPDPEEYMAKNEPLCIKRAKNNSLLQSCLAKKGITKSIE
jgi:hypothetical protein